MAALSPSVIRSAAPAQNLLPVSCANCSAAMPATEWSPCASAEEWAPPESSNACRDGPRGPPFSVSLSHWAPAQVRRSCRFGLHHQLQPRKIFFQFLSRCVGKNWLDHLISKTLKVRLRCKDYARVLPTGEQLEIRSCGVAAAGFGGRPLHR